MQLHTSLSHGLGMVLNFGPEDNVLSVTHETLIECYARSHDKGWFAAATHGGLIFVGYVPAYAAGELNWDNQPMLDLSLTHFRGHRSWKFLALKSYPLTLAALDGDGVLEIWINERGSWVKERVQRTRIYMDHSQHMSLAWDPDRPWLHLRDSARRAFYFEKQGRFRPCWRQSIEQILPPAERKFD